MTDAIQNALAVGLFRYLEGRRKEVGMSRQVVAQRSGLGLRTVQRVLSCQEPKANLDTVLLIADAVGVELRPSPIGSAYQFRRQQAERKATKLASMVQGTSALEAQAISKAALRDIRNEIAEKLATGSRRQLWA